ncbi:hypothetical protein GPA19_08020 [Azoarcus indigens]|uniref:Putative phiE125 gp8 family phage protein n=1 Tax=Azoarcus indigens TaxID=29545 RepID=A0A4R6E0Y4_9RHOO|nr:phage head-tail connector protein [Azoarcus indigens]NMG64890.1 hypothetical protein [Azoarcus indigens]TDN50428.1 putative phiE125 gp8 family phage protein [Azoarcus indigens]
MSIRRIATLQQPIPLEAAKLHLRVDGDAEDADIALKLAAAVAAAEHETGRSIARTRWELRLDAFPREIRLPRPPLAEVESVEYINADRQLVTLAPEAYVPDDASEPAWLLPAFGGAWPDTARAANAVRVRYVAGYGEACPPNLAAWILIRLGDMYRQRESINIGGSQRMDSVAYHDRLLDEYRIWSA